MSRYHSRIAQAAFRIPTSVKRAAGEALSRVLEPTYFGEIPIRAVDEGLRRAGLLLIQEDGEPWSGLLTGRDGRASIDVAPVSSEQNGVYTAYTNTALYITWHRMDETGNYEVVAYLS